MQHIDVSVVIPTYNERENIVHLIQAVIAQLSDTGRLFEILIVDDNSPDGTGKVIRRVFQNDPRIRLYIRRRDPGLGASILDGIGKARGDIVVGMDGDFNHDPRVIGKLLESLKNADVVVASRFVPGGGMEDALRYATSLCFNLLLRLLYGFPIWDNTSGFYAIRKSTLLSLAPSAIYYGYGEYHLRLVFRAFKKQYRIREVPVFYRTRIYGQSKSKFFTMIASYLKTAHGLRFGTV
jgi:dolichol-phosphate mannosyltransferase